MAFNCGCPSGYSLRPFTEICEQVIDGNISSGTEIVTIPALCPQPENMVNGTAIYPTINPTQFPLIGSNVSATSFTDVNSTIITPANNILSGNLWISGGSNFNGLLNQRGVGLPSSSNIWYGVNRCVTVPFENDIISFAISAKVGYRLYIDGVLAVISQPSLPAQSNKNLHVFAIALSQGQHTFRAEGLANGSYSCGGGFGYGAFLCEVYLNVTSLILSSITNQGGLNAWYAPTNGAIPLLTQGGQFDVSSNSAAALFYCPTGYVNACSLGGFTCRTVLTAPYVPCCFNLVNCLTGDVIVTDVDLSGYIGHIITIQEAEGCFLISDHSESIDCTGAITVTPILFYNDCETCTVIYYKLTDCGSRGLADIITDTDLSLDVGLVIKIQGFDDTCWIVTVGDLIPGLGPLSVVKVAGFATCEACSYVPPTPLPDPPFYQLSPVNLKSRRVQPGYDTGHCSADHVEDVNCHFAQQMYGKMNEQRFGVETCLIDNFDKWYVKKQLLDLNLILSPDFCNTTTCCKPCGITPSIVIYEIIQNTTPYDITTDIEESDTPANPPEDPEASIVF